MSNRRPTDLDKHIGYLAAIMLCMILIIAANTCKGQELDYSVPRSVGVNVNVPDTGTGANAPWWQPPWQPLHQTLEWVRDDFDISAVGTFLHAHPWDQQYSTERIDLAFSTPGIDILQIAPQHWGAQSNACNKDGTTSPTGILVLDYPTDDVPWWLDPGDLNYDAILARNLNLFEGIYRAYGDIRKHVFVNAPEAGWQVHGVGCREREACYLPPDGSCLEACEAGVLGFDPVTPSDASCQQACCDMVKTKRAARLLEIFDARQAAADRARSNHLGAALKVWHVVEVHLFATREWQFIVPLCDIIPKMRVPPDFIGLSLYSMADDPVAALEYAMECTGLPAERFFISEVGRRVSKGNQYERIYTWVDRLFEKGVAFALVWSLDNEMSYPPNAEWSVIDPISYEWRGGMDAIKDLNMKWRDTWRTPIRPRRDPGCGTSTTTPRCRSRRILR